MTAFDRAWNSSLMSIFRVELKLNGNTVRFAPRLQAASYGIRFPSNTMARDT